MSESKESAALERKLQEARDTNELQLAKLQLTVKAAKIGLWDMEVLEDDILNPGNPFTWSDEFRHLLGYTDENDFPNLLGSFTDRLHPDDLDKTNDALLKHLLDKTGKTPYDTEYRACTKDGEYRYFHATGETFRDEEGRPLRVCGAIMDITEVKNTLLTMQRLRDEAQQANMSKSRFLSTMSHEIRTPMNAILGITEILFENESLDEDARISLEKIYHSGDMLLGIINDILDFSKIEAGKMELTNDNYELAGLISDTVQLNMMHIENQPVEFKLHLGENLPATVYGDELRVKQILNNILSNAFKYTASGTVELTVTSKKTDSGKRALLEFKVADTGRGMTKEQIEHLGDVYSRFNQEANRVTEGTGLGMSIAHTLINLMDGEMTAESQLGKGSVFTVRIKQDITDEAVMDKETVHNLLDFRGSGRAQMKRVQITREPMPYGKVLVVDDVETNIFVAKGLLSPYLLSIDTAQSGFEAIDKISKGYVYDIIFMDHMMPEMDGIEATAKIREMGYKRPIVALTANAVAGQADIFLGSGFDDFISKPVDIRKMNAVLNKLIRDIQPPEVIEKARKDAKSKKAEAADDTSLQLMMMFARDAEKALPFLESVAGKKANPATEDIKKYTVQVHGLKSTLANIGNKQLSAAALKLEMLGRDGNVELIKTETPEFLRDIKKLLKKIKKDTEAEGNTGADDIPYLAAGLQELKKACDNLDQNEADAIIDSLKKTGCSHETAEILKKIEEQLLHSDFEDAGDTATAYAQKLQIQQQEDQINNFDVNKYQEKIKDIDLTKCVEKFTDVKTVVDILRSYTANAAAMIETISGFDENNAADYILKVHGLKGMSKDIYADKAGSAAEALEKAAKNGNFDYIRANNQAFIKDVQTLLNALDEMIKAYDGNKIRPVKDKPDEEELIKLKNACDIYDLNNALAAMDELEKYNYNTDNELVIRLRDSLNKMDFGSIAEKLSTRQK